MRLATTELLVKELIGLADLVVSVITNSYHYQLGTVRPTIALCPERANIGLYRFAAPCTGTVQLTLHNLAKRQVISHKVDNVFVSVRNYH